MTHFMINVRMRRVEAIKKHSRYDPNGHYKAWQGSRMWTLTDAQVFSSESKALKALKWELERLKHAADQRLKKLTDDLKVLDASIADATRRESNPDASDIEWPRCAHCNGLMPNWRLQSGTKTCGIGGCP